jgi:hypothetical protein
MVKIEDVNKKFNEELQRQIEGSLPKEHIYQLGMPSEILLSTDIPDLPIELRSSRLNDKSMQENHPFNLQEIMDLPKVIQEPMAVFRSATHIGSYVIMTELEHYEKNYIVAIKADKRKGNIKINDVRSVYPKNNRQVANWIDEGLMEYVDKKRMTNWLSKQRSNSAEVRNPLSHTFNSYSKQQYNSTDVRKLYNSATKIIQNFENTTLE